MDTVPTREQIVKGNPGVEAARASIKAESLTDPALAPILQPVDGDTEAGGDVGAATFDVRDPRGVKGDGHGDVNAMTGQTPVVGETREPDGYEAIPGATGKAEESPMEAQARRMNEAEGE